MEIVAVGIVMIEASVMLLLWAFPKLPARESARRSR
jgi:hypothetical protein